MERYEEVCIALKALSNPKRLKIVEMLSCGELCVCQLIKAFDISQPTLSHDLKNLLRAGLLRVREDGKWCYYSLNSELIQLLCDEMNFILSPKTAEFLQTIPGAKACRDAGPSACKTNPAELG